MELKEDFTIQVDDLESISKEIIEYFVENHQDEIMEYLSTFNGKYFDKFMDITFKIPKMEFEPKDQELLKNFNLKNLEIRFILNDYSPNKGTFIPRNYNIKTDTFKENKITIFFKTEELKKIYLILRTNLKKEAINKIIEYKEDTLSHELYHFFDDIRSKGKTFQNVNYEKDDHYTTKLSKYLNSRHEIRTFLINFLLSKTKDNNGKYHTVLSLIKKGIFTKFKFLFNAYKSSLEKKGYNFNYYTPKNQKIVIKVLYKLWKKHHKK